MILFIYIVLYSFIECFSLYFFGLLGVWNIKFNKFYDVFFGLEFSYVFSIIELCIYCVKRFWIVFILMFFFLYGEIKVYRNETIYLRVESLSGKEFGGFLLWKGI